MKPKLDPQIDELYTLPLEEFTKARNALAKTLSGDDKKADRRRSSSRRWRCGSSINSTGRIRSTYKALVDASEKLRAAHRAALSGRKTDTRKPDETAQDDARKGVRQSVGIAQKKGVALTDTVRDTVRRTLAALPTDETPGRMTREPAPVGFSLLTGIKPPPVAVTKQRESEKEKEKRRKDAEEKARKEEEKQRKEQEKREREIEKAEQALREAERRLAKLRR